MSDDRFDLNRLLGIGGASSNHQPVNIPRILPLSGLVCPRCGQEKHLLPDGNPSDSIGIKLDSIERPMRCVDCVQDTQIRRRLVEALEDVPELVKKEDYRASGGTESSTG